MQRIMLKFIGNYKGTYSRQFKDWSCGWGGLFKWTSCILIIV
jgi:hypothetical protein